MKTIITFVLVQILVIHAYCQDTLLLIDGNIKTGQIDFVSDDYVQYSIHKNNKTKTKYIDRLDVYSYKHAGQKEIVLYMQDIALGNILTATQMRNYIHGINDAGLNYKSPLSTVSGFLVGYTGGVFGFWGTLIPTSYVFINGSINPNVNIDKSNNQKADQSLMACNNFSIEDESLLLAEQKTVNKNKDIEYYEMGYKAKAKDKKIKNTIKGAIIGFVSFVATSFILLN